MNFNDKKMRQKKKIIKLLHKYDGLQPQLWQKIVLWHDGAFLILEHEGSCMQNWVKTENCKINEKESVQDQNRERKSQNSLQ